MTNRLCSLFAHNMRKNKNNFIGLYKFKLLHLVIFHDLNLFSFLGKLGMIEGKPFGLIGETESKSYYELSLLLLLLLRHQTNM